MLGWLSILAILTEKYAAKAQEASLKVIVSVLLTTDDRESQIHAALSWILCCLNFLNHFSAVSRYLKKKQVV